MKHKKRDRKGVIVMGLTSIIHNIFNGLKHLLYPVVDFLYYNDEEIFATSKVVSCITILLVLVAWLYKLYMLLAIGLFISGISLLIVVATALVSIWK